MNDNRDRRPDEMILLLGELKGMVTDIKDDVDEVKKTMESDRTESSASRRRMYDKLDGVDRRLTKMESTVTVMGGVIEKQTQRIDQIEPIVKKTAASVKQWTLRWGAVVGAVTAVGGFLWWLVSGNWGEIWKFLTRLFQQ